MGSIHYPLLYQINTRVWLTEWSQKLGRPATLDDVPDAELDRLAELGFDWVWFLSVWQTGPEGQRISRSRAEWRREFQETLPDLCDEDIPGSGFAIAGYVVHSGLGGDAALARLRERLRQRGLRLLLDFVPNHTGLDHPWVEDHPEYYIPGTELDLARAPQNYTWVKRKQGDLLLAHGRDPYFPGWLDTLQLNYGKRLYDRLRDGRARPVREHFHAGLDYQNKMARFLENHDEPRAAAAFSPEMHEAAAVITFLSPGLRFFHQGQFEGRKKRISPHLCRGPCEPSDPKLPQFYQRLLAVLREPMVRDGQWQLLQCVPAWESNWTWECFVAFAWEGSDGKRLLVVVNYAPNQSQCYVRLPLADLAGYQWRLQDRMGSALYDRDGTDLQSRGLFLDMSPWQAAVFSWSKGA